MRAMRVLGNRRSFLATMCCLAATWAVLVPSADAAGALDQSQEGVSSTGPFPEIIVFQIFTAGRTGALDQVDLHAGSRDLGPVSADLLVSIHAFSGTAISATPLANGVVPAASVPQAAPDWVGVPLSPPAAVTAGSTYAIVVAQASPRDTWELSADPDDPYPRGSGGVLVDGDFEALLLSGGDLAFRTYVSAPAVPVTAERLCRDTHVALQSSPRYARSKRALDAAADALCGILARIGPRMTAKQKATFVALYKLGLAPLVRSGWLTAGQAAELSATADRLAAGT